MSAWAFLKKKWKHVSWICPLLGALGIFAIDTLVGRSHDDCIYDAIDTVPRRRIALVLGTAKSFKGLPNLFYNFRLDAAAELYEAGKVDGILVSGDNSRKEYDEPSEMEADLIERGIPGEYITKDYAGFRTLDSIVRAKEVFGVDDYIVVSQRFHCQRALFLAYQKGHTPIAYCARDVLTIHGTKVRLREVAARCKAFCDIYILNKQPHFLGPHVEVKARAPSPATSPDAR